MKNKKIKAMLFAFLRWLCIMFFLFCGIIPLYRSITGLGSYIHAGWFADDTYEILQIYSVGRYLIILFAELMLIASGVLLLPLHKIKDLWAKIRFSYKWCFVTGFLGFFILMAGIG